jgi:hypothetical protein
MPTVRRLAAAAVLAVLCVGTSLGQSDLENAEQPVSNWSAPPYWNPSQTDGKNPEELLGAAEDGGLAPMGALPSTPLPLTAVNPCRIVDTRGANGPFGGPALVANMTRTFNLPSGPCAGIPAGAEAYSLNVTIIGTSGLTGGFLSAWPTGSAQPTVSTLNFNATEVVANAAVVPAGTSGSINVLVNIPGHLLIDINGYYDAIPIVNTVNALTGNVTLAAGTNISITPSGNTLTIASTGGGSGWSLAGNAGTTPGTNFLGTTDNQALEIKVNNQRVFRLEPRATSPNVIGGWNENVVTAGVEGATIAGGGESGGIINRVTDFFGTVSGGSDNQAGDGAGTTLDAPGAVVGGGQANLARGTASVVAGGVLNDARASYASLGGGSLNTVADDYGTVAGGNSNRAGDNAGTTIDQLAATVGGGSGNVANGAYSVVGGGQSNTAGPGGSWMTVAGGYTNFAQADGATVGGGLNNTANNAYATVPGGRLNAATQLYAFAAGRRAKAINQGAFVWGDSTDADVSSTGVNQFVARATGGFTFYPDASTTCTLTSVSGWSCIGISDRNAKREFAAVDTRETLARLLDVPIQTWSYKGESAPVRHMGPMAQDFAAAYGLGADDKTINPLDANGVALAAIQALYEMVKEKDRAISALEERLSKLEVRVK